jgi:hypothetical protein
MPATFFETHARTSQKLARLEALLFSVVVWSPLGSVSLFDP